MTTHKPQPKQAPKDYLENGMKLLDTCSTWLAIAHIGGLAFVYNAILTDQLAFAGPVVLLTWILIGGAANAFLFKVSSAMAFFAGQWPYSRNTPWISLTASGVGLIFALAAPTFYPALAQ